MKKTVDKHFTFTKLVSSIQGVHNELLGQAKRAINISLSLRNWLIGCYIAEYEMRGEDRAKYGDQLMGTLAKTLTKQGVSRCDRRELYRYRKFYLMYPQIVEALTPQFMPFQNKPIRKRPASKSCAVLEGSNVKIVESLTPQSKIDGKTLISKFSFTHIVELLNIEDATKRGFYEIECIRGVWSARELKRQIDSLYYERSGLSRNKKNVMADTDNPPIGILLCTRKDHALVEYALAGLDNKLFVSKYQLELPKQKDMQRIEEIINGAIP